MLRRFSDPAAAVWPTATGFVPPPVGGVRGLVRRLAHEAHDGFVRSVAWLRSRTPEQYLWVFMALVLAAYFLVLFTASTSAGRGGR